MYPFSDIIHDYGLYLPNNPDMTDTEIEYVAHMVNGIIN
jgi:dTDP-4-amino-4,6-dideoxygalactose transaminase